MSIDRPPTRSPHGTASQIADSQRDRCANQVTLFTIPKPFDGRSDRIQDNAIGSWARLQPGIDVLLLGDEPGIEAAARRWGVGHAGGLEYNAQGTPLVSSAFTVARQHCRTPWLAYCNSDVILLDDFPKALGALSEHMGQEPFVAFGRRTDLNVGTSLNLESSAQRHELEQRARDSGRVTSQVCKEYFIFPADLYQEMPRFAVGRGNWDNWMIRHAKTLGLPVINLSDQLTVIHQEHDYQHLEANRFECYVSGTEARHNETLAGGKFLITGSTGTHRLTPSGIRKEPPLLLNREFWADVPRFVRLASQLLRRQ